jgi:CubicO group peptidase (beta-lactamase class C family)
VRLLSPATIDRIFDVQSDNVDLVLGVPERFGLGYGLPCDGMPFPLDAKLCFWGGWGGSMIVNDLEHGMTVAYMMNRMDAGLVGDMRGFDLLAAAFAAIA